MLLSRHLVFAGRGKLFSACASVPTALMLIQMTPEFPLYWLLVNRKLPGRTLNTCKENYRWA